MALAAGGNNPMHLITPTAEPDRERLQHLIIGSRAGVQSTIHTLHVLRYAEQATWSRLFVVPESGLVITPTQGEVFSYLLRWRQLT
jgi:hypothetical protein